MIFSFQTRPPSYIGLTTPPLYLVGDVKPSLVRRLVMKLEISSSFIFGKPLSSNSFLDESLNFKK